MSEGRPTYVTTDADLWNSADEVHFFVTKGHVKPLPEFTTPIIEDALDQGLLREATSEEIDKMNFEQGIEEALKARKFKPGRNYTDTIKRYQKYLDEVKQMEEEKPKMEEAPKEEPKAEAAPKTEEQPQPEAPKEEEKPKEAPKEEEKPKEE